MRARYKLLQSIFLILCLSLASARSKAGVWLGPQIEALETILDWIQSPDHGNGRLPHRDDIQTSFFPFSYDQLVGTGSFKLGKTHGEQALFPSSEYFWLSLKSFARARNYQISLLQAQLQTPSAKALEILRQEVFDAIFEWMRSHDWQLPQSKDFSSNPGQIGVSYQRLTSQANYAPGKPAAQAALFSNPQEFWLALKSEAARRGIKVQLLDVQFHAPLAPKLRECLQQEAIEVISEWALQNDRRPAQGDFKDNGGTLPLRWARLIGTSDRFETSAALFPSVSDYEQALDAKLGQVQQNSMCDGLLKD